MAIRVFHCDDSPAFTTLTRFWLDEHADLAHVGAAHERSEAMTAIQHAQPDVVLLDTMGAPGDGSLLADIRNAAPDARVIIYSGYVRLLAPDALAPGADGYLAKDDDEHALIALIRKLAAAD